MAASRRSSRAPRRSSCGPWSRPRSRGLEALVAPVGSDLGEPEDPEAFREEVAGLVYLVSSGGRLASTAFDELERIGPDATPVLASFLTDGQVGDNEVAAAIDLLAALDHPLAASHLMTQAESHAAPWARARSAWRLGEGTQDWLVPRLLYRLKYEPDHLSALWLCASLAKHGNYSGLTVLRDLATTGSDQGVRDQAAQLAASIPADLGFESLDHVIWEWERGDPEGRLAGTEFSDRYTLAAWRRIVMLDDFQLRPVDDARYILARLGTEVAPWAGPGAARREPPHPPARRSVSRAPRTARCLRRAGARARARAARPRAPQAALALGRVGYPECEPALIELLGRDRPPDMRNAGRARARGTSASRPRARRSPPAWPRTRRSTCVRSRRRASCTAATRPRRSPSCSPA